MISRQALAHSLRKAFSQPDLAVDGETALAQASQQAYDVIFLDVQMPGMDGFELCTKIRDTVLNRATPVVFVTHQSDFDARCKSTLSGGNDLMGKPFLTFEVTVKALTLALHGRLRGRAPKPLPKPDQSRDTADSLVAVTDGPRPVPIHRSPCDRRFQRAAAGDGRVYRCLPDPRVKTPWPVAGTLSDDSSDLE